MKTKDIFIVMGIVAAGIAVYHFYFNKPAAKPVIVKDGSTPSNSQ